MEEITKFAYRAEVMPGKVKDNLAELGKWAEAYVESYRGVRVTPANILDARADLAHLRKVVEACETERKSLKKQWEKPYKEWELLYKQAIDPINEVIGSIDEQVKVLDAQEEAGRVYSRKRYITNMARAYAQQIGVDSLEFGWFWESSWKNKSITETMFQKQADSKFEKVKAEILAIREMENADIILAEYALEGDMAKAVTIAKAKAEAARKIAAPVEPKEVVYPHTGLYRDIPDIRSVAEEEQITTAIGRIIKGPKYKIRIALSIMQELGLEIIKPANPMK